MAEEGFFLGLGSWLNIYTGMDSSVCYPHNNLYKYRRIHKSVKDKINQLECHLDISVQNLGVKSSQICQLYTINAYLRLL